MAGRSNLLKRLAVGGALGLAAGYGASFLSPRIYEARAEIWLQGEQAGELGDALATQLSILQSEGVFRGALYSVAEKAQDSELKKQEKTLFSMYKVDVKPNSAVTTVKVRAFEPEVAATMANEIALTYRQKVAGAVNELEGLKQHDFSSRIGKAKKGLEDAEKKLQAYKAETNTPDLDDKTAQVISYEAGLTARLDSARSELRQVEREILQLNTQIRALPQTIKTAATRKQDPEVTSLQNKLNDLQNQRLELLKTYTEESSRVKGVDESIEATRRQLLAASAKPWQESENTEAIDPRWLELNKQRAMNLVRLSSLQAEIPTLQSNLSRVRSQVAALPKVQNRMQTLQREYDFALSTYKEWEKQAAAYEDRLVSADRQAVTLMNASPDGIPVSPNIPLLVALGLSLGLVGGGLYNLAVERNRKSVRTLTDLEHLTGLPAASATAISARNHERMLRALPNPGSRPAEAFRFLALTNPPGEGAKAILFTSLGTDYGCSNAAGQFALAMAVEGRVTMLVDCDFRSSSLTRVFESDTKPGLNDILRKTLLPSSDNEVSFRTSHDNLLFLPSGSHGDSSIADFSHTQLRSAMEMLMEKADVIILDTPPCDQVTDAVRLAPLVDEVYLIVDSENTEAGKISMIHGMLERCGAKSVRVILSNTDPDAAPFSAA
jgi:succinoglycan biosynthesis transport protein ExoP